MLLYVVAGGCECVIFAAAFSPCSSEPSTVIRRPHPHGPFKRQCKKFRMKKDHEAVVLTAHQSDVDIWINGDYSIPYSAQQVTSFCSQRTAASLPRRALVVLASCVRVYVVREGRGYVTLPFP